MCVKGSLYPNKIGGHSYLCVPLPPHPVWFTLGAFMELFLDTLCEQHFLFFKPREG